MYRVVLLSQAEKFYRRLFEADRSIFERVARALKFLQENPFSGKPLMHKLKGKYSLRVGSYRIIYQVDKRIVTVFVLDIGHRRDIYQ